MDETSSTVSCLAVADNNNQRPQKPGGCVGIFFHLFDWNRRFAKRKKLFSSSSKKLLPPSRTEHPPSIKFAADEKMPKSKPHMLVDPKKGGNRSCSEIQKKQEMRPPSLVAKLMGLDSMPAKKYSNPDSGMEKASAKVESSRPQKLQKTGGFGAEALQIRNVLQSARKQHNHSTRKLASPVKSPKFLSSTTRHASTRTSKLIDAATRILEPGLQATQRAKSAIAYSNSMRFDHSLSSSSFDEVSDVGMGQYVKEQHDESSNLVTSCNNCGNLVDVVVESRLNSLASHFANSSHGMTHSNQGRDPPAACKRKQSSEADMQEKARAFSEVVTVVGAVDRQAMPMAREFRAQGGVSPFRQGGSQPREETSSPSAGFKQRSPQANNKTMSIGNDDGSIPRSSFISNIESSSSRTKDFIAMNRSLTGRSARPRVSNNMERKFINRRDDGLPPLRRKRRIGSSEVDAQLESSRLGTSTVPVRQRNINVDAVSLRSGVQGGGGNIGGGAASFTFSSPLTQKTGRLDDHRRNQRSVDKQELLRRDALGALIQEKLKELICQEENEGGNGQHPIRSTASILQELISALTIEQLTSPHTNNFPNLTTPFQKGRKLIHDSDHLSPGSVLDASFSTESCLSSSLDDNSVCRLLPDFVDTSHDMDQGRTFPKLVTNMLDHISRILQSITLAGGCCQWTSRDLGHAKETILTAELLFGRHSANRVRSSVLERFLLDEFHALSIHIRSDGDNFIYGMKGSKKEGNNQLRRLLFDCVIEWLDLRCRKYCDSSYRTWRQLLPPQEWCTQLVNEEVGVEMKRWTNMEGMIPDEILELEIGQSMGKWTEFEMESCEISRDIVEALLEEIVRELWL